MRSPLHSFRERIIALVRREVAETVTREVVPEIDEVKHLISIIIDRMDNLDGQIQAADFAVANVISRLDHLSLELQTLNSRIRAEPFRALPIGLVSSFDGSSTIGFDNKEKTRYVDFVDVFRPSFQELYDHLSLFRNWFPGSGTGVDLGAGRGEMVKVMTDHGLKSFGIDSDASVVEAAAQKGIDVRKSSIDEFFSSAEANSFDVVTAIQVVEHVDTNQLESWFAAVKRILKDGGLFFAETPNPHAIDAFKAFWVDVTHVRPYYPESLLHMAQAAGFSRAEIWAPGTQMEIGERLGFAGSYVLVAKV
jgi:2-polyprenyl-3-methyl-5-hydroxy-6-metoxy-1,4-benzoquinol methylase